MNCTVRDWTSSAKLSSLRGIHYLGALIASMQFWESLSTLTLCIFNRLAKIIAQWIVKKTVLNNCRGDDWMIGKMWKIERNNIGSLCNMVNMEGSKWGWIQPNWENSLYKLQIYKSKFKRAYKKNLSINKRDGTLHTEWQPHPSWTRENKRKILVVFKNKERKVGGVAIVFRMRKTTFFVGVAKCAHCKD